MRIAVFAGFASALVLIAPAHAEHLAPRNDCRHLAGFEQFERALVTAVANRYTPMLKPIVDPNVHLDFGGGSGWDELVRRLDDPERNLWSELSKVLALGCGSTAEDELSYPWLWSQDLGIDDPFSSFVALGDAVPLRKEPSSDAPILRNLNWEAVRLIGPYNGDQTFLQVRTRRGETGFVAFDRLRAEIDYRLLAVRNKQTSTWQVTNFVAGD